MSVGILITALNKTGPALRAVEAGFRGLLGVVRNTAGVMTSVLMAPIRALLDIRTLLAGGGAAAGLAAAVKKAFNVESSIAQFKVLTGDMTKAKNIYAELKAYADENPIYDLEETLQAGKLLMAFGVQTKDLMGVLRSLADVSAAVNMPLSDMADIVGRNIVQGRLYQIDLRQLQGRGVPIIAELAKIYGVAATEVMGMATAGKISSQDMLTAFKAMTAEGGRFGGMVEELGKTGNGLFDRLKADWSSAVTEFGQQLSGTAKGGLQFLIDKLAELRDSGAFAEWGKRVAEAAETVKASLAGIFSGDREVIDSSINVVRAGIEDAFTAAVKVLSAAAPIIGKLIGAGFKAAIDLLPYSPFEIDRAKQQLLSEGAIQPAPYSGGIGLEVSAADFKAENNPAIRERARRNRERANLVDLGLDPDKPYEPGNSALTPALDAHRALLLKKGLITEGRTLGNVLVETGTMRGSAYDVFNPVNESFAQKALRENSLEVDALTKDIAEAKADAARLNAPGITGPGIKKLEAELSARQAATARLAAKVKAEGIGLAGGDGNAQGGAAGGLPGGKAAGVDVAAEAAREAVESAVFAGLSDAGKRYALSNQIRDLAKKYAEAIKAGSDDAEDIGKRLGKARADKFALLKPEDQEKAIAARIKAGEAQLAAERARLEHFKFLDPTSAATAKQQARVDEVATVLRGLQTLLTAMVGTRAQATATRDAEKAKAEAQKIVEAGGTYKPGDTFDAWLSRKEKAEKRAQSAAKYAEGRRGMGGDLPGPEQAYSEAMGWRAKRGGFDHVAAKGHHFEETGGDVNRLGGSMKSAFGRWKSVNEHPDTWESGSSLGDMFTARYGQKIKGGQLSPEERTAKATEAMKAILQKQYEKETVGMRVK